MFSILKMNIKQIFLIGAIILSLSCSLANACQGKLIVTGISNGEKQIILQEHNRLRQLVATGRYPGQPGAENMREIIWDEELAARAQQWAENCQFRHDPHRTINRFTMGQNLAIIWSTAPLEADDGDFPSRIQSWFNEVQKYSFGDAWSPKTGHYSQLVWGETSLVGCGFAEYKDASKYNKLYVCNYGPGGNVVGYNPYEVGKPSCATYGMRPSPRYQGLCAAPHATVATSSVNSISSNTIETYEYNTNKNYNNNKQINNIFNNNKQTNTFNTQKSSKTSTNIRSHTYSPPTYPTQASTVSTSSNGNSFGTATSGGSTAYTTETSQYKYKNKFEAYKPSSSEFQKSVQKHTLLRTYIESTNQQQQQHHQQQQQQQQQGLESSSSPSLQSTPKPAKRGWSLLTWRG